MTGSSLAIDISKVRGEQQVSRQDSVAVEEPLEIQLCSPTATASAARSISITMRTPGDDTDLAVGFLFGEGIIRRPADVEAAGHVGAADPGTGLRNTVRVELKPAVPVDLERLQRHFYTTSSCGVCGKASVDALRAVGCLPIDSTLAVDRATLVTLPGKLRERQRIFGETGGLHAAAVFDAHGDIVVVREDVGRHNAVDKVIGALLMTNRLPGGNLGLLVSGRASFELMQKALVAGIPMLAAVGAPSSLAVALARDFNMTLVGFLRDENFNIYAGAERISQQQ